MDNPPLIRVAAAIIRDGSNFLVTRRPGGGPWAGWWEFPGGKIEPGETAEQALAREVREELGVEIEVGSLLRRLTNDASDRRIELNFHHARVVAGAPQARQVAELGWRTVEELAKLPLLPLDLAVLDDLSALAAKGGG